MGSSPEALANPQRRHPKDRPSSQCVRTRKKCLPHRVFLFELYLDTYEVTNARFQQFVQATGYCSARPKVKMETGSAQGWRMGRCPETPGAPRVDRGVALPGGRLVRSCR